MAFPTTIYDGVARAKVTTTAQGDTPLGTRLVIPDGRVFRYAQAGGTALSPFKLVKCAALGPWSTMSASDLNIVARATSYLAGATQIKFGYGATGTAVADYFKDGYMIVQSTDTAETQFARIGTHLALQTATTLYVQTDSPNVINIPDGLDLAMNTETDCWPRLIPNPYKAVILTADEDFVGGVLGIPIVYVAASSYFWCQTWGPAPVLQDAGAKSIGALAPGYQVYGASGSTGGVSLGPTGGTNTGGTPPIDTDCGRCYLMGAIGVLMQSAQYDKGYALINLRLAA